MNASFVLCIFIASKASDTVAEDGVSAWSGKLMKSTEFW